jgi:hypothetical protein
MNFYENIVRYSLILVLSVVAVFTFFYVVDKLNASFYFPILCAAFITTFNFALGIFSIKSGLKKQVKTFLILFLGGMVFRLLLMLGEVFICLKFLELRGNNFIFSVFIFYVFYQIIEILYVIYRN